MSNSRKKTSDIPYWKAMSSNGAGLVDRDATRHHRRDEECRVIGKQVTAVAAAADVEHQHRTNREPALGQDAGHVGDA
jgi:hypothetical protein